ncbi:uncharacterized protein E6C27_scaffold773G00030 [Cucumis melo var. makuwa]|uniref:CACTA en-spm transposon protein n=1 Tax=Cucumis melo var. makuwa TaxID=1194695 RepID=A0A5A7UAR8_CUCMM|nr:uncharacterized protein E6C27_scaffold773G00030 [Cucumis melo var. makuwa]
MELFRETHVRAGTFVSQAVEDTHVLSRQPGYSKGLGWRPKSKARKTTSASSFMTSCLQPATKREIQIRVKLDQALERIEVQDRNYQVLASEMEQMRKLIQDMTRAQQGPPYDPYLCGMTSDVEWRV